MARLTTHFVKSGHIYELQRIHFASSLLEMVKWRGHTFKASLQMMMKSKKMKVVRELQLFKGVALWEKVLSMSRGMKYHRGCCLRSPLELFL